MGFMIVLDDCIVVYFLRKFAKVRNSLGAGVSLGGKDITGALGNSSESSCRSEPVSRSL